METIQTQSKGYAVAHNHIEAMFDTHSNVMLRINYLLDLHRKINPDIEDADVITSIKFEDGFINVSIAESYSDGFINTNSTVSFSFGLQLFSDDESLEAYVEIAERTYRIEKEEEELKKREKTAKREAKAIARKLKKAKKLLAKNGYAVILGAPIIDSNENSEQEGSPE